MTSLNRPISKLPLSIFQGLKLEFEGSQSIDPEKLREEISKKLKNRKRSRTGQQLPAIDTLSDLIQSSPIALLRSLDPWLTFEECKSLLKRASSLCIPEPQTVYQRLKAATKSIPTGLATLDRELRGGLQIGAITEFVGKAGAGKTQLSMQSCILASGRSMGCIFIDTEKKLSLHRLAEMAAARAANDDTGHLPSTTPGFLYSQGGSQEHEYTQGASLSQDPVVVLQNVRVHQPTSTDELIAVLESLEDAILLQNHQTDDSHFPIGLVVVDSIAAPARRDFGKGTPAERTASILYCAQILKRLADELQLAVIVINQVGAEGSGDDQTKVKAALGSSWHYCVSTSVMLATTAEASDEGTLTRSLSIVKSNYVQTGTVCPFKIDASGVSADNGN